MAFDELCHESFERTAAGGYELQSLFVVAPHIERPLDSFHLPSDAPYVRKHLFLIYDRLGQSDLHAQFRSPLFRAWVL
jgi:hypothetical protein